MKKYEYKVERIAENLESYLNDRADEGCRCVSVMPATGLGWTQVVVLEKIVE